ncbi:MAG: bifunctional aldolase/short-chain dehydrogenase, partial [Gammaproteobacteria bacterium]|nr:bifunctional aldolase/short-chain dehydrogenase [Gammaproteobacteria bacterium]
MKSLWQDAEVAPLMDGLALRVYTSRLLGRDKSLVLHGGGNTSVKLVERNRFDEEETILYVKGSGWDLETIEAPGFSPVRLDHVRRLAGLERLSDPEMVNELVTHVTRASAPTPSVETILHACIPHAYVDHTHADAVLAITNTPGGEARIRAIYGDSVIVIPYLMPGFDLAQAVAREIERQSSPRATGLVLLKHGIFSFGATAREAYERMIDLVDRAERYLSEQRAWDVVAPPSPALVEIEAPEIADLRRSISDAAGFPMIVRIRATAQTLGFARHPEVERLSQQGPATPDHVIRTKRTPMLGTDVAAFGQSYREYFDRHAPNARDHKTPLDPAPRMVLDPRFGLAAVGRTARDSQIVAELYEHTIDVILRADALERYEALPAQDIFDVEYWDLEQAKLRRSGAPPALTGEVAWVTGAASGIGKAAVASLLAAVLVLNPNATLTASAAATFTDVPESHPFFDEIEWLVAEGITTGFSDGTVPARRLG